VEEVVNLPLSRWREVDGEWADDFFDLEGAMIFVIQLP